MIGIEGKAIAKGAIARAIAKAKGKSKGQKQKAIAIPPYRLVVGGSNSKRQ